METEVGRLTAEGIPVGKSSRSETARNIERAKE